MTSSSIRLSLSQQRVVDYRGGDLQVIACGRCDFLRMICGHRDVDAPIE